MLTMQVLTALVVFDYSIRVYVCLNHLSAIKYTTEVLT